MDNNFIPLVKSSEITINDTIYTHIDGQNNAIMKHQNISEDNCLICQIFKSKYNHNGSNFQYMYGIKHVYDDSNKEYKCYIGELVVNRFSVEYLKLVIDLSSKKIRAYEKLVGN